MDFGERAEARDAVGATVTRGATLADVLAAKGRFEVECRDRDGNLRWRDHIDNLVMTVGKNDMLDKYLGLGAAHTAVRMGLKGTGTPNAADTMASHATWLEQGGVNAPTYTGNRPSPTFAAAAAGSKATSAAVSFAITSSGTVFGCFICMSGSATKDDTTGTLLSAGDFSGGSKAVGNGDTLNVTYSLAL